MRQGLNKDLETMDRFMLRGKLKDLMLGIWVIPHIMGPLTMFDITLIGVKRWGGWSTLM